MQFRLSRVLGEVWKDQWLSRIRRLYRLNAQRLRYHDPGRPPDRRRYLRMQFRLSRVLGEVFAEAETGACHR